MSCTSASLGGCIKLRGCGSKNFKNYLRGGFRFSVCILKFSCAVWSSRVDVPGQFSGFKFILHGSKNSNSGFYQNNFSGNGNNKAYFPHPPFNLSNFPVLFFRFRLLISNYTIATSSNIKQTKKNESRIKNQSIEVERLEEMGGGHGGSGGTTYKGYTLHQPKCWHVVTSKGLCAIMWFWVFYRAKQDGPVVLGWRHPWEGHGDHSHGHDNGHEASH